MANRTFLVLALVVACLLALSAPAAATWADSTYLKWSDVSLYNAGVLGTPVASTSPHGAYTLSTKKCGVCHAVHRANTSGQALMRSTRTDACTYCHISPGISVKIVYDGDVNNYSGSPSTRAHQYLGEVAQSTRCSDCHQVHGAVQRMTANAELTRKILRGDGTFDAKAGTPTAGDSKNMAVTRWCGLCHGMYYDGAEDSYTHVMTSTLDAGTAYTSSEFCVSCHSANQVDGAVPLASAFPHYTDGSRFLTIAVTSGATPSYANTSTVDGVCLRCHRSNTTTDGVGLDF